MKKITSLVLCLVLLAGCVGLTASADEGGIPVFVTITDGSGKTVLAQEKITVTDKNSDGHYSIDEALYAAHEAKYPGGAAAGYASGITEYGLSLLILWGENRGYGYGFYVNGESAWSLDDEVKSGDYVDAFVYQDTAGYSDAYSAFDVRQMNIIEGDEISLVLLCSQFDLTTYTYVKVPVANAVITINGAPTEYKTDADGKVSFPVNQSGEVVISAVASGYVVPPVLTVSAQAKAVPVQAETVPAEVPDTSTPAAKSPKTGESCEPCVFFTFVGLCGFCLLYLKRYAKK